MYIAKACTMGRLMNLTRRRYVQDSNEENMAILVPCHTTGSSSNLTGNEKRSSYSSAFVEQMLRE